MKMIPEEVFDKYINRGTVQPKIDELFGEKFSIRLDVERNGDNHDIQMSVTDKDGNEIEPRTEGENVDPVRLVAFVSEVSGVLVSIGDLLRTKAAPVVNFCLLAQHPEEVLEHIANETENSNED